MLYLLLITAFGENRLIEDGDRKIGNYYPIGNIISICSLYFFLLGLKKYGAHNLNLKVGNIRKNILISFVFTIISVASLSVWFISQGENPYAAYIPDASKVLLVFIGIGFAAINSIYEEGIFRSIFFSFFLKRVGYISALLLQALWFSFLHYQSGFPSGITGILLTFFFGIMMGYLVHRTKGIIIPVIIHFAADISIFLLILSGTRGIV